MKYSNGLPTAKQMISSLVDVLSISSTELNVQQIEVAISELLDLSEEQLSIRHDNSRSEFQYRLAWTRSYAKKQGLVISPRKKYWTVPRPSQS